MIRPGHSLSRRALLRGAAAAIALGAGPAGGAERPAITVYKSPT